AVGQPRGHARRRRLHRLVPAGALHHAPPGRRLGADAAQRLHRLRADPRLGSPARDAVAPRLRRRGAGLQRRHRPRDRMTASPPFAAASPRALVLYDGLCGLCDSTVQWLLRRDQKKVLTFAALQGETARPYLAAAREGDGDDGLGTLVLVERDAT